MLKYFVRRSKSEEFQQVEHPPEENVWIHGEKVHEDELHDLSKQFHLNYNILRDVLDEDELPRVETKDGVLYVFVRTVVHDKQGKAITAPLLLIQKNSIFINIVATTTSAKISTPAIFSEAEDTTGYLLGTIAAVLGEYEELIKHTNKHIFNTAQRLRTREITNDDFIHFVTVEDNLNAYHMNLSAILAVGERLRDELEVSRDKEALEDILLYVRQLLVAIQSHNQSIRSIRNSYRTIANNTLNQRMKNLTVLTVLIALPNVFYGMYGMNVVLPFAQEPWAFAAVLIGSIVAIAFVYIVARKKGIF